MFLEICRSVLWPTSPEISFTMEYSGADALFENIGEYWGLLFQCWTGIGSRMMQMQYWISRSCYLIRNGFWDLTCIFELYAFFDCIMICVCLLITRFRFSVWIFYAIVPFMHYSDNVISFILSSAILFINEISSPRNHFTRKEYHFNEAFEPSYIDKEFQR